MDFNDDKSILNKKGETPHYCKECNKYYASFKSYGNHMRSYHNNNNVKPQCTHCGNVFTRRDNLQQHIRLFHSQERIKLMCEICNRPFLNKKTWSRHSEKCTKRGKKVIWTNRVLQKSDASEEHNGSNRMEDEINVFDSLTKNHACSKDYKINELSNIKCNGTDLADKSMKKMETNCQSNKLNNYPKSHSPSYANVFPTCKQFSYNDKSVSEMENVNVVKSLSSDHQATGDYEIKTLQASFSDSSTSVSSNGKVCEEENKALDCAACEITFLSKEDHDSHLPFCQGL